MCGKPLEPGVRVAHRLFGLTGTVVAGDGKWHYKVRVDPECDHFSEFVYIMPEEIVRLPASNRRWHA